MIEYALFFIGATLLSFILTPAAIWLAQRAGAMDVPSERKVHSMPTPRLGGLAVFGSVILCLGVSLGWKPGWATGLWTHVIVGALVVFLLGFTDDLSRLGPKSKLAVQGLAALLPVAGGLRIETLGVPGVAPIELGALAGPATIVWIVGVTNAFNLIDGLDGLASGLALIGAFALFALNGYQDPGVAVMAVVLAGALAGFLRYNFNPARIFLGDSGSLFAGFLLACLAVRSGWSSEKIGFIAPLSALAIPVLDTIVAMIRRYVGAVWHTPRDRMRALLRVSVMFEPDRAHIHHQLLDHGLTQRQAVMLLYGFGSSLAILGFYVRRFEAPVAWVALGIAVTAFFFVRLVIRRRRSILT